ncbi:MAG: PKD domain-containing protein, partial [Thermoplasmata archaeon]
ERSFHISVGALVCYVLSFSFYSRIFVEHTEVKEMRTFDASQSYDPDGSIVNYNWQMNKNDASTMMYGAVITYKYVKAGNYTIVLTVTDNNNTKSTIEIFVNVEKIQADTTSKTTPDLSIGEIVFAFVVSLAILSSSRILRRRRL